MNMKWILLKGFRYYSMAKERQNKYVSNFYLNIAGFGAFFYWFGNYIKTYYATYYFTNILMLSPLVYTTITSINSVINFFWAPVMGAAVDSGKQGRLGKYRKWMLIGPNLHSLFYILSFLPIIKNEKILVPYLIVTWVCSGLCMPMILMPYYALHAKIANSPNQRTQFVARRNFFVNVAQLVYAAVSAPMIAYFAKVGGSQLWGYEGFIIVSCVLSAIFWFLEFKMIGNVEKQLLEDYPELAAKEAEAAAQGKKVKGPSIGDFFKNVFTNLPFAMVAIQQFQFGFGTGIRNMLYVYYFTEILKNPELYNVYIFLNSWMGIAATLSLPLIAKKLENTQIAFWAFVLEIIACVGSKFTLISAPWLALGLAMVYRYCSIIVGSINASMFQDTAIYAEWKNGTDTMATVIGASQVVGTISSLISSSLYSVVLIGTGYKAGEPITEQVQNGIINGITMIPLIACVAAAIAAKLNPLTNEKLIQYKKEIDERKGKLADTVPEGEA